MVQTLDAHIAGAIDRAALRLAEAKLVVFPTETVYGLGARADSATAVRAIFAAKGRPSAHPLIVHVSDETAAAFFAARWPPLARQLAHAFWPGPLTMVVPRRMGIADDAAGGQATIGLRCPSHPMARDLLAAAQAYGVPGIAAPSANRFGKVSPTLAVHAAQEFRDQDDLLILDGGPCEMGIESAIVDCTRAQPVLLRPGTLPRSAIEQVVGILLAPDADAPRAPGTLNAHYAPRAKVRLMPSAALSSALDVFSMAAETSEASRLAVYSRTVAAPAGVRHRAMPDKPAAAAHELFAALRELDAAGVQIIWVEQPPSASDWDGVRDRLQRAAAA